MKLLLDKDLVDQTLHDEVVAALTRAEERGVNRIHAFGTIASAAVSAAWKADATLTQIWEVTSLCWQALKTHVAKQEQEKTPS